MKKLSVLTQGIRSEQWNEWVAALADTHFIVEEINSNPLDYEALMELQSDAILLDGQLAQLTPIILVLHSNLANVRIIVASDTPSFSVQYTLWTLGEIDFISGPMDSHEFRKTVQEIIPDTSTLSSQVD